MVDYEDDEDEEDCKPPQKQTEVPEEERVKNKSPCREIEQEQSKRQRLCSTIDGNKNPPEQGGEAKEPENSRSSNDNSISLDGENDSKQTMKS